MLSPGFPREILDALLPLAANQGFRPDFSVASDEVAQVSERGNKGGLGYQREKKKVLTPNSITEHIGREAKLFKKRILVHHISVKRSVGFSVDQ